MKWQTFDLPCGCNGHVFGPLSVRRNDLFSLSKSKLNDQLAERGKEFEFVAYVDLAYILLYLSHIRARHNYEYNSPRHIVENKTLSSCRECIEWDYSDVGRMWGIVDYKYALKIRRIPVAAMYLSAMILRNAHNCTNGGITSLYFNCLPPIFEDWVGQGPRYVELPNPVSEDITN